MPPNTGNDEYCTLRNHLETIDIGNLKSPIRESFILEEDSQEKFDAVLYPDLENHIYVDYDEIHESIEKSLIPSVRNYQPDVMIAVNSDGHFVSLILSSMLGYSLPILPTTISSHHDFVKNEDKFDVKQWFDESSSDGLRVNGGRLLIVAVSDEGGIVDFVRSTLMSRYMPACVSCAVLHKKSPTYESKVDIFHAKIIPSYAEVCYPWNSPDLEQHQKKAVDQKFEHEHNYWDWPEEDPVSLTQVEKSLIRDARCRNKEVTQEEFDVTTREEDNYWNWDGVELKSSSEVWEQIRKYEAIRHMFSIDHKEECLLKQQAFSQDDISQEKSELNVFLADYCDYWDWPQDERNYNAQETNAEVLDRLKNEEAIRLLLSVSNIEMKIKPSEPKQNPIISIVTDDIDYWTWQSPENLHDIDISTPLSLRKEKFCPNSLRYPKQYSFSEKLINWIQQNPDFDYL